MTDPSQGHVFVSYSSHDEDLVSDLVELLRVNGEAFFAADSIRPGANWAERLKEAIEQASEVVIFWCCHASESEWVRRELEQARASAKTIIPMLLCDYERPPDLRKIQWHDLKRSVHHSCRHTGTVAWVEARVQQRQRSHYLWVLLAIAASISMMGLGFLLSASVIRVFLFLIAGVVGRLHKFNWTS